jgi:hypothetical protein
LRRFNIVAYRPVDRQRPRNKQEVQPSLCIRPTNKRPFLSNGSVNTFRRKRALIRQEKVFTMWSVQSCYKEENWGNPFIWGLSVQLSSARESEKRWRYIWVDSWQEISTGGCDKRTWGWESEEFPLLEAVARERLIKTQQAGKSLAGAVVICKVWRSAKAL